MLHPCGARLVLFGGLYQWRFVALSVSVEPTIWTSDVLIDGVVKLPVRETATELTRCATGESVRRVRDIAQRGYDSSNDEPRYLHSGYHLVGKVNLGSK
jgi:hypothetical protein